LEGIEFIEFVEFLGFIGMMKRKRVEDSIPTVLSNTMNTMNKTTNLMSTEFKKSDHIRSNSYTIGVISDTHGLLRPEVMKSFRGVDLILHAGDVGDPEVIDHLESVAPVVVVRGNMDYGSWAEQLPVSKSLVIDKAKLFLIHDIEWIDRQIVLQGYQVIITGHTHRPLIDDQHRALFFNPGSAGHLRHGYPVSVGKLFLCNGKLDAQIIQLDV
jgi:putative phosphoesterase